MFFELLVPSLKMDSACGDCFTHKHGLKLSAQEFILVGNKVHWGPLLGIRNLHPSCIRWCLMHVVHLGLLYKTNGSGLFSGLFQHLLSFCETQLWLTCRFNMVQPSVSCPFIVLLQLRNLLLRCGFFGNEPNIHVSVKLSLAYRHFKGFCSARKVECSQPEFSEKMVTCFN